jgi:ubiquinone/menaquinone biosynthesis C-methylase UbiE
MPEAPRLDPAVGAFYAAGGEEARLTWGPFQIERVRTEELLLRHLPPPPAKVLDVGGAAGAYACWLALRGYEVTLVDPVPLHLEQAGRACDGHRDRAIAHVERGDARALTAPARSFDAVLMLGPLYHLPAPDDRRRAWAEARRVARPGAPVLAAAISRFASMMDGLVRGLFADPAFAAIAERDAREGVHTNDSGRRDYFTTANFHRPSELAAEAREAGLLSVEVFGIEGPGGLLLDFDGRWADAAWRERLLWAARVTEQEPSMMGVSAHLLAVGRTPEGNR